MSSPSHRVLGAGSVEGGYLLNKVEAAEPRPAGSTVNTDDMAPSGHAEPLAGERTPTGAADAGQPALRIVNLEKRFRRQRGEQVAAVDGVSLDIYPGQMVTMLGPSGCGKTTLLRCAAGLEEPSGGEIWAGDRLLSSGDKGIIVPPDKRTFGMMFQTYAVWPHMSVYGNVAYPLRVRRWSKSRIEERVGRMLEAVGILHLRNEYPTTLSGGQQQRVALARSLVHDPTIVLFDEPLSNVDAKVREELRVELLEMQRQIGFAGIYVTHDQEEAMAISDLVVVMNEGKVLQVAAPREVYRRPASRFIAGFVGVANIWEGQMRDPAANRELEVITCAIGNVTVAGSNVSTASGGSLEVVVLARPEDLTITTEEPAAAHGHNVWRGRLHAEMFRGADTELLVEINGQLVRGHAARNITSNQSTPLEAGGEVFVSASPYNLRVLPAAG
jgi:iron(III) transport system ATP-binding protein